VGAGEDFKSDDIIPIRFKPVRSDDPPPKSSTNQKKRCFASSFDTVVNHPFVQRIISYWNNTLAFLPTPTPLGIFMC